MADKALIVESFRAQAGWCERLGSPFTAALLSKAADDIDSGGPAAKLLHKWNKNPYAAALALRFAGALNFLVMDGRDEALAAHYPAVRQETDATALWIEAARTLHDHETFIRDFIEAPVQTNELRRSICLLGGFLEAAARYDLPMRVFEIGSSAGANLLWDSFHYKIADRTWGNPHSPITLTTAWSGGLPPLDTTINVVERAGCDINPINVRDAAQMTRALAYIWPDQPERVQRFKAAAQLIRETDLRVEQADAGEWLHRELAEPMPGTLTVMFHSVFWQYMSADSKAAVRAAIDRSALQATASSPFAWLRMEPEKAEANVKMELRLSLWPGEIHERLAWPNPHGIKVDWGKEPLAPR